MKWTHKLSLFALVALLILNSMVDAQSRARKTATQSPTKQVTVTLVRWPYT